MVRIMRDATTKASAEHKRFEQDLKARRKQFSESLNTLQARVDAFQAYDVSARRAEYAREVCSCKHVGDLLCKCLWKHMLRGPALVNA
jgi:hypothetical protein